MKKHSRYSQSKILCLMNIKEASQSSNNENKKSGKDKSGIFFTDLELCCLKGVRANPNSFTPEIIWTKLLIVSNKISTKKSKIEFICFSAETSPLFLQTKILSS